MTKSKPKTYRPSRIPEQVQELNALRLEAGRARTIDEYAALEAPFELRLNGRSHTLLMIYPRRIRELALGFCLSEGLIKGPEQVQGLESGQADLPGLGRAYFADLALPPDLARQARVRRVAPAATSCGLCGLESLDQLARDVKPVAGRGVRVDIKQAEELLAAMEEGQEVFGRTGATHGACLGTADGRVLAMAEDVGRHNALDKAIGAAVMAGEDLGRTLALLTGRVSYEIALKVVRAGITLVGSISAPTALGIRLLDRLGVTLLGFMRHGRANVYTHHHRVLLAGRPLKPAGNATAGPGPASLPKEE